MVTSSGKLVTYLGDRVWVWRRNYAVVCNTLIVLRKLYVQSAMLPSEHVCYVCCDLRNIFNSHLNNNLEIEMFQQTSFALSSSLLGSSKYLFFVDDK